MWLTKQLHFYTTDLKYLIIYFPNVLALLSTFVKSHENDLLTGLTSKKIQFSFYKFWSLAFGHSEMAIAGYSGRSYAKDWKKGMSRGRGKPQGW